MIEESRSSSKIHRPLNSTFIANIPKCDLSKGFEYYKPTPLCNCISKLISKVIASKLKPILSSNISLEQFSFLDQRNTHDAIGVTQEALHSFKIKSQPSFMLKIDLPKTFDKVNWLYLRLILTQASFPCQFIN